MNSPTRLTIARMFFIPFIALFNYFDSPWHSWVSMGVFLAASLTDSLDGYLARRNNQVTTLGKLLDPLADKLLVLTAFLVILERHALPAWVVIILIGREMAVTGLRAFLAAENVILPAGVLGKWKMGFQVAALCFLFVATESEWFRMAGFITIGAAMAFSLLSAYFYIQRFWRLLGRKIMQEQARGEP